MSFDEQNVAVFIELLTDKRSRLFSAQDRNQLAELIAPLPDDIEQLSSAIASWYEKRPKICDAQLALLNEVLTGKVILDHRLPGTKQGQVPEQNHQLNKQTLKNAIQDSSGRNSQPRQQS